MAHTAVSWLPVTSLCSPCTLCVHSVLYSAHMALCCALNYFAVRYCTLLYLIVQYSTIQYFTERNSKVQYSTQQYNTVMNCTNVYYIVYHKLHYSAYTSPVRYCNVLCSTSSKCSMILHSNWIKLDHTGSHFITLDCCWGTQTHRMEGLHRLRESSSRDSSLLHRVWRLVPEQVWGRGLALA